MPDLKTNPSTTPSTSLRTGVLYYGDNLEILRDYIPAESVDLVYLAPPPEPMRVEAATAGFHSSLLWERDFPIMQISTMAELLEGKQPELPGRVPGFARAPRVSRGGRQMAMSESGNQ